MGQPKRFLNLRYFWPAYLWGILVMVLIGLPGNDFPTIPSFWESLHPDKIVHMGMFGMLILLLGAGSFFKAGKTALKKRLMLIYVLAVIALGGLTELLQKWVFIGRSCDINDFYADIVGVIFAVMLYYVVFENGKQNIT